MLGMPQVAVPWTAVGQDLPVTGVRSGINAQTGEVPARRDINSLYDEGGPQWDLLPVFTGSRTWLGLGAGRRQEQTQGIVRTIKCYSAPGIVRIFHCMRYTYPESALQGDFGKFDGKNYTKRCVDDGQSFPESANDILSGFNLKEKVYNVFLKATSFDEMVSAQSQGANFEGPHGEVHVGAACGQDLVYLSTSAFDPLFWLHHTNVDRLIAYWQALHFENATMHFSYPSNQLFATPRGTITTPESPMMPFIGRGGEPLTSESVTQIRDWGYTYAPMRFWEEAPGETKMAVSRTVNSLYAGRDDDLTRKGA
ncbi:Tyrosinase [Colletotrichum sp. SAR 10_86]|nr:Tyrosinase [Colletotrichum sp. SAR 10_86]